MEAHNPDMLCIVETWLCADVLDSEIALPGYQVYRKDRNRHGGGVLIYVRDHFVCNILPSADNLEIITVSVCHGPSKVFYHFSTDPLIIFHRFLKIYFCTYNHLMLVVFVPSCTILLNHFVCHRLSLITLIWVPTGLPP